MKKMHYILLICLSLVLTVDAEIINFGTIELTETITSATGPTESSPSNNIYCRTDEEVAGKVFTEISTLSINDETNGVSIYGETRIASSMKNSSQGTYFIFSDEDTSTSYPLPGFTSISSETTNGSFSTFNRGREYAESFTETRTNSYEGHTVICRLTYSIKGRLLSTEIPEESEASLINQALQLIKKYIRPSSDKSSNIHVKTKSIVTGVRG